MLTGLRIFFGLLTLVLGVYYFTKATILPYIQLSLACMFIIMGISELKANGKTIGIASFLFLVLSSSL